MTDDEAVTATPLLVPAAGTPPVIADEESFKAALAELAKGAGPFAVDAERASGYKYSARAYLIQIKRNGGGLHLIDPIPFGPGHQLFAELNELLNTDEVILHASTQDLPCLRELGINPKLLFDTELGGRIAGLPRFDLGPLCTAHLSAFAGSFAGERFQACALRHGWRHQFAGDPGRPAGCRGVERYLAPARHCPRPPPRRGGRRAVEVAADLEHRDRRARRPTGGAEGENRPASHRSSRCVADPLGRGVEAIFQPWRRLSAGPTGCARAFPPRPARRAGPATLTLIPNPGRHA